MNILSDLFTGEMVLSTLRMAIPLILASIGGTICERSGIVNLGIEGMMLSGAFGAVMGTHFTGSPWLGVVTAIAIGGMFGLLHAVLCIHYRTNQSVSGVGINIFVGGLTVVLTRAIWNSDGLSGQVEQLKNTPFLFITIAVIAGSWFVLYQTRIGLRLRSIGDHPQAVATAGINVSRYRYIAVIICGMLCGLAGAYLSIVQNSLFVQNMVAGRGFMALAAMIFGGWNPIGASLASLLFAFAQAIRINLRLDIPNQLLQILPYVLTLVVLISIGRKVKGPEASGKIED